MKHTSYNIPPTLINIILAIIVIISGLVVYKNNENITDFEIILIIICVFTLIKGIITFIDKVWLKQL